MKKRFKYLKIFGLSLSMLILSACGKSGDEISKVSPAQVVNVTVSGGVTKGVLVGATINAYNIAIDGTVDYTIVISSGITDENGLFNLDLPTVRGHLLLQSSGGDFIDETDQNPDINQKRKITFSSEEGLSTVLPPNYNSIALTMISQSIYVKSLREFTSNFYDVYQINIDKFTTGLGFDPLSIIPANPVNPDQAAPETARQYALLAGGLANIVNQVAVSLGLALPTYEIIKAVIEDFSDGNIDGTINDAPISVVGGILPSGLDLDAAIIRFKNNNFTNFQTTSIPEVDYNVLEVPTNVGPDVNAGVDQTILEQEQVSLSATATDSDGTITTIEWNQEQGTTVLFDDLHILNPSFTAPDIDINETQVFTLTVTDDFGESVTDSVSINIIAISSNAATVAEGASVTMNIALATPNSSLIITDLSTVTNGSLVNNNDGTVTYTHDGSETVDDSFSYTINDGEIDLAPTIVNITVTSINDAPTATAQILSTAEDTPLSLTLAGIDVDGTISSYSHTSTTNGSLAGTVPNLTYTPNSNFNGSDSFTFTVTDNDGVASVSTTINITVTAVNDPPTITSIAGTTATEDILYSYTATVTDIDDANDGTQLTWSLTEAPIGMVVSTTGVVTWTPLEGILTSGLVTLRLVDGGEDGVLASVESFTITVTPVNDAPTATPQTLFTAEDTPLSITLAGIDVDGTISSYSHTSTTSGRLAGTVPNLTYTPNSNFNGSDNFTFTVTDNDGVASVSTTITITVTSVNDLPSINMPADQNVGVDIPVSLTATASDVDGTISGYQWAQTSGIDVTASWTNANSQTASFNSPITTATTTLSFTLTVTDNDDGQTTTAHNMTVTPVLVADLLAPTSVFLDSTLSGCVNDNAIANGYTYVHEFVSLNCDSYWVSADYTGMDQLPNLLTLNFTRNYFDDLFFLPSLPLLTTLTLDDIVAWNTGLDISSLSSLNSLTSLSLSNADVAVADLSVLSSMTSLTVLNLPLLGISDITFLSGLSSLTSLDLSSNSIVSIAAVSNLSLLKVLTLSNNQINSIPISTLPTTLSTLYLDNNSLSATSAIVDLSSLTSLANLDLSFNSLSDISSLSALAWLSGTLNLSDNASITDLIPLFGVIESPGPGTDGLINLNFIQTDNMSFGHCSTQIDDLFRELPTTTLINYGGC